MTSRQLVQKILYSCCVMSLTLGIHPTFCLSQELISDKRIEVNMRKIGHEVLKCLGDDQSRVLPIEQINHQYKIPFASDLSFNPDDIVTTIDRVMKDSQIANHYFVQVEQCETNLLMHSYEMSPKTSLDQIACIGRILPLDCYSLILTIVDDNFFVNANSKKEKSNAVTPILVGFISLCLIGFLVYIFNKNKNHQAQKNHIHQVDQSMPLGTFHFDPKNMLLISQHSKIELSQKETKLLSVLHDSVNQTVHRNVLLQKVWKDEGDYIGRTLDVFISKLRKKLDADSNVKIITERGVGYKLVLT